MRCIIFLTPSCAGAAAPTVHWLSIRRQRQTAIDNCVATALLGCGQLLPPPPPLLLLLMHVMHSGKSAGVCYSWPTVLLVAFAADAR
jgi:hypothetical protein